ncbi:MBL fold metallo-hydrolase [Roseobacter sp. YSTF-M11]|uniref:MBL fold metallo-hydrolase n=1 Tax=Roseobacter insulae TaxID=2859783 RepID=A0A9X1FVH7_9RHOB|nr:MBL fold metallo-hydrolase [Roseobacter insulae]MBW4708124.1 MBL fold metallo-hydrolase [Roseobacter insulae]
MQAPDEFDPEIGRPTPLRPGLRRIVAPNPSPMTYRGTNTYLLGRDEIAVIDPGPDDRDHLDAILAAIPRGSRITHILVSHAHLDHSPLARRLQSACGAPISAFGPAEAGRSAVMERLLQSGMAGGGEGIDTSFSPDIHLREGDRIASADWRLDVIHTPGHLGNHICFAWGDNCFTADHVMGWASSLVSPPDGDLTDFMASCARLQQRDWEAFFPGHGEVIGAPNARLDWLVAHRLGREVQILEALRAGPATAEALARAIYVDTPPGLLGAASRNVLAHLIDLKGKNRVMAGEYLQATTVFELR